MIIIDVNGNIEKALKEYKRKVAKVKQNQQLRNNQEFEKPSVTRRTEITKAKYVQAIKSQADQD
jgi:small subunit ribosomal protein S21